MRLLREWYVGGVFFIDTPSVERLCGSSLKWMCTDCGNEYAWMKAFKDNRLQAYTFIHGCCYNCVGNRFHVPGSLECIQLLGWYQVPPDAINYQFRVELDFLSHPHHPHNEGIS